MGELSETRWRRYGKDRVYLRTADDVDVGYVDLVECSVHTKVPEFSADLAACLERWVRSKEPALAGGVDAADAAPIPEVVEELPSLDLAVNGAGSAARLRRDEVNGEAPVLNFVARVFGLKTPERAWRVGAKGEEKVGKELAKLGSAWRVLHAVEVGDRGSDIDHVVVGPPGVFTLNTKRHPGGKAWVGERMVMVNRYRTDYLRNSRFEARRAERLLTAACGFPVAVQPVVVFVDLADFTLKRMPADVFVLTRRRLVEWLTSLQPAHNVATVEAVYAKARLGATWR